MAAGLRVMTFETDFFFSAPTEYDEKTIQKRWQVNTLAVMNELCKFLNKIEDFSSSNIEEKVKEWVPEKNQNLGVVMNAFRLALVGAPRGPHLFDIATVIGKDETIARIKKMIETLEPLLFPGDNPFNLT